MKLVKTEQYSRVEKRFFKKRMELLPKYAKVLKKISIDPFDITLKTHKLKGDLSKYYACSLTYDYRIVILLKIIDDEAVLINIGSHDDVY
jgi:mRNA-degrading endonuclease YafQ of YafQ-DinJ toxin-antitoxin module